MKQSQTGAQPAPLLPAGSVVELEVYTCMVPYEGEEIPSVVVTCDTLKLMQVIPVESLAGILAQHGITPGSADMVRELALSFQMQCGKGEDHKLWPLNWSHLLDRKLFHIVRLEIQPAKGEQS